jgi:hypothetical protein
MVHPPAVMMARRRLAWLKVGVEVSQELGPLGDDRQGLVATLQGVHCLSDQCGHSKGIKLRSSWLSWQGNIEPLSLDEQDRRLSLGRNAKIIEVEPIIILALRAGFFHELCGTVGVPVQRAEETVNEEAARWPL